MKKNLGARTGFGIFTLAFALHGLASAPETSAAAKNVAAKCSIGLSAGRPPTKLSAGIKHAFRYSRGRINATVVFDADELPNYASQEEYQRAIASFVDRMTGSKIQPSPSDVSENTQLAHHFYFLSVSGYARDLRQIMGAPSVVWIAKTVSVSSLRRLERQIEATKLAEDTQRQADDAEMEAENARLSVVNDEIKKADSRLYEVETLLDRGSQVELEKEKEDLERTLEALYSEKGKAVRILGE